MAKVNKDEALRREGMSYALRIAKEKGVEALEEDLKFRGATNAPLTIRIASVVEWENRVRLSVLDTVMCLACVTLRDQFGFGQKRMQDFIDRFEFKSECLYEGFTDWEDQRQILKDELGIDVKIRYNSEDM